MYICEVNGEQILVIDDKARNADCVRGMSGISMVVGSKQKFDRFYNVIAPALTDKWQHVVP